MATVSLLWGLCGDQLSLCRPINLFGATHPTLVTCWTPLACRNSAAQLLPDTASRICSGWTHTVLTTDEGLAYAADTSQLVQALHSHSYRTLSRTNESPATQQQQQQQQQDQQQDQHSNSAWQLIKTTIPNEFVQSAMCVLQVAAGDLHCLLLDRSGSVWAFGSNQNGQLGALDQHCSLASGTTVEAAAAAAGGSSQVWDDDQGGVPRVTAGPPVQQEVVPSPQIQPVRVLGPGSAVNCQEPVAQVAAGACHSLAVTADTGRLYCWGWSAHGQCCIGSTSDVLQPTLCAALDGVPLAAAAAGMAHTVVLSRDGAVYTGGWNSNGQLGLAGRQGSSMQRGQHHQQQQQQQEHQQQLLSSLLPVLVESDVTDEEHIIQVACGSRHSVALAASGKVFTWGFNKYGQCCTVSEHSVMLLHNTVAGVTAQGLPSLGGRASSSSSSSSLRPLRPQADVSAPDMVVLPEEVRLAAKHDSQSGQPVGPKRVAVNHMQHSADADADEDCKVSQIVKAVGIQAGRWHTLIEVQLRQLT